MLDPSLYREIEADPGALREATVIVALAGLARGVGSDTGEGFVAFAGAFLTGFAMWLTASVVVWLIGVRSFGFRASYRELLRTLGFAASPLIGLVFCAVPFGLLSGSLWVLLHSVAILGFVIAVREALRVPTAQALWICFLGLAVGVGLLFVLALLILGESVPHFL